jgi:osmotically-inducible protein OsmY
MDRKRTLAVAALLLAGALPALADDSGLAERIEKRLDKAGVTAQGDIRVTAQGDERAVLDGAVLTVQAQREAEKVARKEAKTIDNRLRVVPEQERSDAQLLKAVQDTILRSVHYGVFDSVGAAVQDGVLVLNGSVRRGYARNEIVERASRVEGLRGLKDQIALQSVSQFDDRLRRQLYLQIYGERFTHFANPANPPVRIVVDRGRVTLTGSVPSNVDRVMIGHIARDTMAFKVDNRLEIDSEREKEQRGGSSD